MGTLLSHGVTRPATGDRGSSFYTWLEELFTAFNSHDHDGTDSEAINAKYLTKTTETISSASWAAVANHTGTYKQTVTMPSGFTWDSCEMKFFLSSAGHLIYPTVEKASSTTYVIYFNDNSLDLKVTYG